MITYSEDWLWPLLFRLDGSVYFRSAMFAVPSSFLTFLLVLLERWAPGYRSESLLEQLGSSTTWSMLTAVLVFTVGFRTQQGLARFWEGTGLLHQMKGEWFDTVSNCVSFTLSAAKTRPEEVHKFRHTIVRLMSLCHGSALEEISGIEGRMETIDVCGLNTATLKHLKDCVEVHHFNKVEVLLHLVQSLITHAHQTGILDIPPPILSRVYQTISRGYVHLLNSKKITDTKFPFPYVQVIAILLLINTVMTPLVLSVIVDSMVIAPLLAFIPVFGTHALNFISMELEDPFGEDPNDLPLAHFQAEMNNCLFMLLHPNSDIVANVSDRCIMDFEVLKETVSTFRNLEPDDRRRTSVNLFDPSFRVIGSKSNLEAMMAMTGQLSLRSPTRHPPECPAGLNSGCDLKGFEWSESDQDDGEEKEGSDSFGTRELRMALAGTAGTGEPPPVDTPAVAPQSSLDPALAQQHGVNVETSLVKNMDDFTMSLRRWADATESHVRGLASGAVDPRVGSQFV